MSIQIMSAVRDCGPRDLSRYSVLETLANYADDFGFCFPGIEKIAYESRCDERTVRRQIVELEQEGWLYVTRRVLNGKANVYQINLGKIGVTVPANAKRNPVFTRLLKDYGDIMSPIFEASERLARERKNAVEKPVEPFFAPQESADTASSSEDNPQALTGLSLPTHRTFEGGSPDKLCPPNLKNHQEPPIEPSLEKKNPPTPLEGGGSIEDGIAPEAGMTATWQSFLLALKSDLISLPAVHAGGRFSEIVPGQNDFDTCFLEWWLAKSYAGEDGRWWLVTRARDPMRTMAGLDKYRRRIETLIRNRFLLPPYLELWFDVRQHHTLNPVA